MIERLERVVPEAAGKPNPLEIAQVMQPTTRQFAFEPESWTPERAKQTAGLFDSLAPTWRDRASELRDDALQDAFARGAVPDGLVLEVGSGTGVFTWWLAERTRRLVAVDLSLEMLRLAPADAAPRVCADAATLPVPDACVDALVLVNCFLFPPEADRVIAPGGALVWVSTLGDYTPIYLSAEDVVEALPGRWHGVASEAGWGSWAVVGRAP